MTTVNDEKKVDYWDQVETSTDFNLGLTGNKLMTAAHIEAKKPGEIGSESLELKQQTYKLVY